MATADDQFAVRNVIAKLGELTDIGSAEDYMALVADDAVIVIGDGTVTRTGAAEIRAGVEASVARRAEQPDTRSMHFIGSSSVSVAGDEATASTTFVFYRSMTPPEPQAGGRYQDTFVRSGDGWRLRRRQVLIG